MIYPSVPQVDDSLEMSDDFRCNTQELAAYIVGNVAFGLHIRSSNTPFLSAVGQKPNQRTRAPLALTSCRDFQTMLDFQKLLDGECGLCLNVSKSTVSLLCFRFQYEERKECRLSGPFVRTMLDTFPKKLPPELGPLVFCAVQYLFEFACVPKTTDPIRLFLLIGERVLSLIFDKLISSIMKELVKSWLETGSKNQSQAVNLRKSVYLRILFSVRLGTRTRLAAFLPFM